MSKRNWSFNKKNQYGVVPSKEGFKLAEYPPFTAADLNSTDMSNLGGIVKDTEGRVYMKVRYAQTTTAGIRGKIVAFPNSIEVVGHAVDATNTIGTTAIIKTTRNTQTKNSLKDWFVAGRGAGVAGTIAGMIRRIYSNDSVADVSGASEANLQNLTISEFKKEEIDRRHYDGNQLKNTAGAATGLAASTTYSCVYRPSYDVVLCDATADDLKSIPVGVLLGAVTAATGAYETSDTSGTPETYYSTWIQIFGPGLVFVPNGQNAVTGNVTMLISSATAGNTVATTLGVSAVHQAQSIGICLTVDAEAADRLIPVWINPGYFHFYMGL